MQIRALPIFTVLAGAASAQLDDTSQWDIEGDPGTELGTSCDGVGDVGDVNGDGFDDVHVGRAYLFTGGSDAFLEVTPTTVSPGDQVTFSYTGSFPGTTILVGLALPDGTPGILLFTDQLPPTGCLVKTLTVPPFTPPGSYFLVAGYLTGTGYVISNIVEVTVL